MIKKMTCTLAAVCCFMLAGVPDFFASPAPALADAADKAALKAQLEVILQEHPELLLNVLKGHSEDVYRIAMEGAQKARVKAQMKRWEADLEQPKKATLAGRAMRGPKEAPVTIVAFSDFTCPYCEQMAHVVNNVLRHYTGTVNLVFKHFPLESHAFSREAAEYFTAAAFQDNAKAWALHDALFADRQQLMSEGLPFLDATAKKVGLDVKRLKRDVKSDAVKAVIEEDMQEAQALKMQGTPYFLVNNILIRGALPLDLFAEAVDMALAHENKQ